MSPLRYSLCTLFVTCVALLKTEIASGSEANETYRYYQKGVGGVNNIFQTRQQKLINFNTDGEIKLDLDFTVPFIKLPVPQSMDMAKTALISLNVGSLVLTGVVVFAAAVILPLILALVNKKGFIPETNPLNAFYSRSGFQRGEYAHLWSFLENDIDLTSCSQRIICYVAKTASQNVARGRGSSADKIIDGLISSRWIQRNILSSMLYEAVRSGVEGDDCASVYRQCKIKHETMYHFVRNILGKWN